MTNISTLRKVLRQAAPAKLVGRGRRRGFRRVVDRNKAGRMLRGLTGRLEDTLFSNGVIPTIARRNTTARRDKAYFKGKMAGFKRGQAVDAQLSAIADGRKPPGPRMRTLGKEQRCGKSKASSRKTGTKKVKLYHLTNVALHALSASNLQLVRGQQPVVSDKSNVATAIDLIAIRTIEAQSQNESATDEGGTSSQKELVLIELKTGYDQGRLTPLKLQGGIQQMRGPLYRAVDCLNHRHLAQLAASVHMFTSDRRLAQRLTELGISRVTGALLYVTDEDTELQELDNWWRVRGKKMVEALA